MYTQARANRVVITEGVTKYYLINNGLEASRAVITGWIDSITENSLISHITNIS